MFQMKTSNTLFNVLKTLSSDLNVNVEHESHDIERILLVSHR